MIARLLGVLLIGLQCVQSPVFAAGTASSGDPQQVAKSLSILFRIEGMLISLQAFNQSGPDGYDTSTDTNGEEWVRLIDYFQYVEAQLEVLESMIKQLELEPFKRARAEGMLAQIRATITEQNEDLEGQSADDVSDLTERLDTSQSAAGAVLNDLKEFVRTLVADIRAGHPIQVLEGAVANSPQAQDLSRTMGESGQILTHIGILRAILLELQTFSTVSIDFDNNDDDDERYAEYYVMVSYLKNISRVLKSLSSNITGDPDLQGFVADVVREIESRVQSAEDRHINNRNVGTDEIDSDEAVTKLQARMGALQERLSPIVALYERRQADSLATLDSLLGLMKQKPELFTEAQLAQAQAFEAERNQIETRLAQLTTHAEQRAQELAQQTATAETSAAQAQGAAAVALRNQQEAEGRVAALLRQEETLAAAILRHRQELAAGQTAADTIMASIPGLRVLVNHVFAGHEYGQTAATQIQISSLSSRRLVRNRHFRALSSVLGLRMDSLIMQMRQAHKAEFDEVLNQVGARGDFNISDVTLTIANPSKRMFSSAIRGSVMFSVNIQAMGITKRISLAKPIDATFVSKNGDYSDAELDRFVNQDLPRAIVQALSQANPELSPGLRMTQVVSDACETMIAAVRQPLASFVIQAVAAAEPSAPPQQAAGQ